MWCRSVGVRRLAGTRDGRPCKLNQTSPFPYVTAKPTARVCQAPAHCISSSTQKFKSPKCPILPQTLKTKRKPSRAFDTRLSHDGAQEGHNRHRPSKYAVIRIMAYCLWSSLLMKWRPRKGNRRCPGHAARLLGQGGAVGDLDGLGDVWQCRRSRVCLYSLRRLGQRGSERSLSLSSRSSTPRKINLSLPPRQNPLLPSRKVTSRQEEDVTSRISNTLTPRYEI